MRAAGVREVRFHDLRHTFGMRMAAHRDIKTTQIYTDYESRNGEGLEAIASAFSEVKFDS